MDSVITKILTDETVRSPKAAESFAVQQVNDSMSPWLNEK